MSTGRILIETTNLDTGEKWRRELGPDEYAIVYGPELELADRRSAWWSEGEWLLVRTKGAPQ